MKKLVLILLLLGGFFMHRIEGANAIVDSAGHRIFTDGPPGTTIPSSWLNAVQEEIATVITNAGLPLKTAATETGTQLWDALTVLGRPYDYIVNSNATFAEVIERVAANQYRIKSEYRSLFFSQITGGYPMPLSDGDIWGYIETNACVNLTFEFGAYINMGNERGYIEINTEGCLLDGVSIRGLGTVASAIQQSFLLNADYVNFINCNSINRLTNVDCYVFKGDVNYNDTVSVVGCKVADFSSTNTLRCFGVLNNLSNCVVDNISSTSNIYVFASVINASNCVMKNIYAENLLYGMTNSSNCSGIWMEAFDIVGGIQIIGINNSSNCSNIEMRDFDGEICKGISSSSKISNVKMSDIEANSGVCYGVDSSDRLINIDCVQLDATGNCYAFTSSNQLSNCYAENIDSSGGNSAGYYDCDFISASVCNDIDAVAGTYNGFENCDDISSSKASNCENGFDNCANVSSCDSSNNDNHGYFQILRISSSRATANSVDGFNDCTTVGFCMSTTNTNDGYKDCDHIEHNRSLVNGGVAYNNSFADLAATRACAATDNGGDNA